MLDITLCTVYFFKDAMALVKMDNKSLFNKKKIQLAKRGAQLSI